MINRWKSIYRGPKSSKVKRAVTFAGEGDLNLHTKAPWKIGENITREISTYLLRLHVPCYVSMQGFHFFACSESKRALWI